MKKTVSSEQIRIRFLELVDSGQIFMGDEMIILQHLVNKFNLISSSEYAKINRISPPAVRHRIKKEPTIKIGKLNYFVK